MRHKLFNPNIPAIIAGVAWVLFVAYWFGLKERKRLGITDLNYVHHDNLTDEQRLFRRTQTILGQRRTDNWFDCNPDEGLGTRSGPVYRGCPRWYCC